MSLGSLTVRVVLNHRERLHCGDDPVTGHVIVGWLPGISTQEELFGPLKVTLSFHGRAKTKIRKSNGNTSSTYRGRAPLFAFKKIIYDSSPRIVRNKSLSIPFTLKFPECTQQTQPGDFTTDSRYNVNPKQPLPPSFMLKYRGFAHHFDTFTEYRVGASASMAHIDVESATVHEDSEPYVKYAPARMPLSTMEKTLQNRWETQRTDRVQNENLVPESERASGFKQKTKAIFKSDYYPEYTFGTTFKGPKAIYLEQPIAFEVRIKPAANPAAGVIIPEIALSSWNAKIEARTEVRAERSIISCPESEGNETVLHYAGSLKTRGPFSKANDWTKTLVTRPVADVPSSFSTFNIKRTYTLKIEYEISAAGKSFRSEYVWPLTIHPPLAQGDAAGEAPAYENEDSVVAGSSTAPEESLDVPPPAYEKVADSVTVKTDSSSAMG